MGRVHAFRRSHALRPCTNTSLARPCCSSHCMETDVVEIAARDSFLSVRSLAVCGLSVSLSARRANREGRPVLINPSALLGPPLHRILASFAFWACRSHKYLLPGASG